MGSQHQALPGKVRVLSGPAGGSAVEHAASWRQSALADRSRRHPAHQRARPGQGLRPVGTGLDVGPLPDLALAAARPTARTIRPQAPLPTSGSTPFVP
jgi:hypothetical protein